MGVYAGFSAHAQNQVDKQRGFSNNVMLRRLIPVRVASQIPGSEV